jgi:hypothetical protein
MAERKNSSTETKTAKDRQHNQTNGKQGKTEATSTRSSTKNAKPATITVTLNVTVPESTAKSKKSVYVAGNFNQFNNKHADWDTQSHKMKKVDATHYTLTLKGPENAVIEYKYTLGDWEHVERNAHCHDLHNRRVTLHGSPNGEQVIEDVVHNWRSLDPCKE